MKRALAERAKQSGLPNGVGPSSPAPEKSPLANGGPPEAPSTSNSQNSQSQPSPRPQKTNSNSSCTSLTIRPPLKKESSRSSLGAPSPRLPSSSAATPTSVTSPRPKKRMRESLVKLEEEDEDDANASAFFLRHQNRTLASELRNLKYQSTRLERERDYRRKQCSEAVQILNALQATWTQMEAALQCGQPPPSSTTHVSSSTPSHISSQEQMAPLSTGLGTSVELIGTLLDSLVALGTASKGRIREDGDEDDDEDDDASENRSTGSLPENLNKSKEEEEKEKQNGEDEEMEDVAASQQQLDEVLRITDNINKRALTMQSWIWSLLQRIDSSPGGGATASLSSPQTLARVVKAERQAATLKAKNKTLKAKLKELARSRDELFLSDKRVRRGLYRLAAGRVQLKEVLKAIVSSDEDKDAAAWLEVPQPAPVSSVMSSSSMAGMAASQDQNAEIKTEGNDNDNTGASREIDSAQVGMLKKQLADLEQISKSRDEQIRKLLSEKEEQVKKINSLVLKGDDKKGDVPTDEEMKRSDLYAQLTTKLAEAERKAKEMERKQNQLKGEWSKALADAEATRTAMEDMQSKHLKKWAELVGGENDEGNEDAAMEGDENFSANMSKAEQIAILEHKLTQALGNVRQAETTRKTLAEAVHLNEQLQAKLEEIKAKYSALQQGRSGSSNNHSSGGATTPKSKPSSSSSTTPGSSQSVDRSSEKAERSEKSEKSADKLHRDYRRVRKELAAATASKEAAKAKLERTEKERDALNQTNSRLLKQATEKDEMNAKSLSTILHLKQLTDQINKEKENLEQQVKSAQQLALAARLAANARVRLSEEIDKDRKEMESRVQQWEKKFEELAYEKESLESKLSQHRAKLSGYVKEATTAKGRCDELAAESTKLHEENQKITETLAVVKKEAMDATKLSDQLAKQSGGGGSISGFTVDQLNTQVSVLKGRLACPVCNHRDKKCILLRCRHMFCKPCVDENIKNRSRKCPACGGRFDTKDVADVWL